MQATGGELLFLSPGGELIVSRQDDDLLVLELEGRLPRLVLAGGEAIVS